MTVTKTMGKETSVAKLSQVLSIEPSTQINFRGDFRQVISVDLTLTNATTDRRVCFKVKTNYPHRYFVRPNGGLIEPSEKQTVTIMLQPLEVIEDELKLHKFMVQAIYAPEGPISGLEKLWKETKQENIMDTKIRCTFEQIQSISEETPRYRGGREAESNGTHSSEQKLTQSSQHKADKKKDDSGESSSAALLIVFIILFCLIVFAYLKMK